MIEKSIADMVKKYLNDNGGFVEEQDIIRAIAILSSNSNGDVEYHLDGECTESNLDADIMCGAKRFVDAAMYQIHQYKKAD